MSSCLILDDSRAWLARRPARRATCSKSLTIVTAAARRLTDDRVGAASVDCTWHERVIVVRSSRRGRRIADAVLDRLVHTAHRLALDGETLREPPEKSGKLT